MKGETMISLIFFFSKKIIKHIEELKNKSDKDYFYEKHTHYFHKRKNISWKIVNIANKFKMLNLKYSPRY